jgi:hypothetical protein
MKIIILFSTILMLLDASCRQKPAPVSVIVGTDSIRDVAIDTVKKEPLAENLKTKGKVSHQYASKGCATVIVAEVNGEELTLIPQPPLEKQYDKDGLEIFFNYHTLRRQQPPGCEKGMPAEITDISFK